MKKVNLKGVDGNAEELLSNLVNALSIPFLNVEFNVNPVGFNVNIGGTSIGADYLEERYNINKEKLTELAHKHLEPAIDNLLKEIRENENA